MQHYITLYKIPDIFPEISTDQWQVSEERLHSRHEIWGLSVSLYWGSAPMEEPASKSAVDMFTSAHDKSQDSPGFTHLLPNQPHIYLGQFALLQNLLWHYWAVESLVSLFHQLLNYICAQSVVNSPTFLLECPGSIMTPHPSWKALSEQEWNNQ